MAPLVEAAQIQRNFGDQKGFGAVVETITIVTRGVSETAELPRVSVDCALHYASH